MNDSPLVADKRVNDWLDLAQRVCEQAGILPGRMETIATWNQLYCANAIFRLDGGRYLKLFGPQAERQFHIERAVLRTLAGQATIPAPQLLAAGEPAGGPPYLLLAAVLGETAEVLWDELDRSEQLAMARELGTLTAAIHRLPQEDLAAVEARYGGKEMLVRRYHRRWLPRIEAAEGLSASHRRELRQFLQEEAVAHLDGPPVLTHWDMAHNHIYLAREGGRLHVSGIIDWAEAALGPAEWDLVYLWFWTFSQDREAMAHSLQTYFGDSAPPVRFARRCLAALFHTSSMGLLWPSFLERGVEAGPALPALTAFLFPEEVFGTPD